MKQLNIALAAAVAALTFGMASQASAADVQIYGRIDAGLVYEHTDPGVGDATDKFTLDSGVGTASRFGLRGSEDLGNGYQVKFVLENGYKTDTGALSTANTIFDREATLQLVGPFGTISAGRSASSPQYKGRGKRCGRALRTALQAGRSFHIPARWRSWRCCGHPSAVRQNPPSRCNCLPGQSWPGKRRGRTPARR